MKQQTFLKNRKLQYAIKLITALCFALFTAYNIYLAVYTEQNRTGRLMSIAWYSCITVASFLVFSRNSGVRVFRTVLMTTGLSLLFINKLLSLPRLINEFDLADPVSVMNFAVFIFAQLGTIVLLLEYLFARSSIKPMTRIKITRTLMFVAIGLFAARLLLDLIMMLGFHANIDLSLKYTLISRFLYFFGYTGTAVIWRLPAPNRRKGEEEEEIPSEKVEDNIDFVL